MRKLFALSVARCPDWMLLPTFDRDHRRLVVWSYVLLVRVSMLARVITLSAPIATPWLVKLLRRQSDVLSVDIASLKRRVRERHRATSAPAAVRAGPPPNPWG